MATQRKGEESSQMQRARQPTADALYPGLELVTWGEGRPCQEWVACYVVHDGT